MKHILKTIITLGIYLSLLQGCKTTSYDKYANRNKVLNKYYSQQSDYDICENLKKFNKEISSMPESLVSNLTKSIQIDYLSEATRRGLDCGIKNKKISISHNTNPLKKTLLGVNVQAINKETAYKYGRKNLIGALVEDVTVEGPAFKSGIKVGDIILKFGDISIQGYLDLPRAVSNTQLKQTVLVTVWRNKKIKKISVYLFDFSHKNIASNLITRNTSTKKKKPKIENLSTKTQLEFPLKPIPINFPSVSVNRDNIAVIIGNANYKKMGKDIPNVNPAYADAEGIKQYFMKAKGIKEGNIIYLKDATNAQLLSVFGNEKSHKGKLFNYIKPNKSNVYIYYAGHGAPGEEGDAYLVPTDTDSQTIEFTGYPLSTLYSNLGKLPAKSVTVILEACFSGGSQSGSLISKASPIVITPKKTMIPANVKVIAAGSERQMASWEEDSSHSLFTKYFLKAMSGEGDSNKDGKVSDAELKEYLSDTMTYYARRYYGRDQKVQIHNGG